jgi:hypothetical protein
MERLSPVPQSEPLLPEQTGSPVLRTIVYLALIVLLGAGGFMRFHDTIIAWVPALGGPAAVAPAVDASAPGSLVELALLPRGAAAAAIAAMGLSAPDAAALARAAERDQVGLARIGLFDASGGAGRAIQVSAGGFTSIVPLGAKPVIVTLPIGRAGVISFQAIGAGADPVSVGALTLSGPVRLPDIAAGQQLMVDVIAQ